MKYFDLVSRTLPCACSLFVTACMTSVWSDSNLSDETAEPEVSSEQQKTPACHQPVGSSSSSSVEFFGASLVRCVPIQSLTKIAQPALLLTRYDMTVVVQQSRLLRAREAARVVHGATPCVAYDKGRSLIVRIILILHTTPM